MSLAARIPVEFPLPDSLGWLEPEEGRREALQVRVIQHDRRDGTVYVAQAGRVMPGEQATAHRRVPRATLHASEAEAVGTPCKPCRGTGQRRRTRKGVAQLDTCAKCAGTGRVFP